MLSSRARSELPIVRKGEVLLCDTCLDARGMGEDEVTDGARRSSMSELTERTAEADKVLIF
jgi:uncharacterized protein involved in oxidation of intracellular sulfur